jgi:starvation-inducible outer membrane lipoprotein
MRWILLALVLTGCASAPKQILERCIKPSYDINAQECNSPYDGCDPTDMVAACQVLKF